MTETIALAEAPAAESPHLLAKVNGTPAAG
jgi:hypothetical protein